MMNKNIKAGKRFPEDFPYEIKYARSSFVSDVESMHFFVYVGKRFDSSLVISGTNKTITSITGTFSGRFQQIDNWERIARLLTGWNWKKE